MSGFVIANQVLKKLPRSDLSWAGVNRTDLAAIQLSLCYLRWSNVNKLACFLTKLMGDSKADPVYEKLIMCQQSFSGINKFGKIFTNCTSVNKTDLVSRRLAWSHSQQSWAVVKKAEWLSRKLAQCQRNWPRLNTKCRECTLPQLMNIMPQDTWLHMAALCIYNIYIKI